MDNIKILLVEDHTVFRMGLSLIFENTQGLELIGEATTGKQGVDMALKLTPDIILMDIGLPEMDGIQATRMIKKSNPSMKILIFTSRDNENDVFDSLSAGADGYIMKGATADQIVNAIKAVSTGTAWLDPSIARLVLSNIKREPSTQVQPTVQQQKNSKNVYGLTNKELEVLGLIVEGKNNEQIAKSLVVTLATAKAHVHNILQKLYVKNKTQATIQAIKEGIV